jgi:hypothetical protein
MTEYNSLFSTFPLHIVVFDLDETLGYFVEFGMFWSAIETYYGRTLSQSEFNDTLDIYPEFVRPDIVDVLTFLKTKKQQNKCSHVMIYTNNQGPKEWAISIKNYFEYKMQGPIFDKIVAAFKVNGKQIEVCRTSHNKKHDDFIKCTKIPANSQICFIDDVYHEEMINDHVYYINVKPYVYDLPYEVLVERYIKHHPEIDTNKFNKHVMSHLARYNHENIEKNLQEYEIDIIITKQILQHIKTFFTKNRKRSSSSITHKNKDK